MTPCTVAVRALCEFTAKEGDLDLRFTPAPSAQEGIAGHQLVASRRGAGYETEVSLSGSFDQLTVRGRADGYDPVRQRLEEVKTHKGRLDRQPANHRHLHWAQLKLYGALLCAQRGLAELELALVYFDIDSQQETVIVERHGAASLQAHFEGHCRRYLAWALQEAAHREARDAALTALAFPHAAFRTGQRPLAQAVYQTAVAGRCLMAQAPTGIGKTVGTLFPLLKACPGQGLDKIFFLTAKTAGRALALDALALLQATAQTQTPTPTPTPTPTRANAPQQPQTPSPALPHTPAGAARLPLRTLELVARDKACEHPDLACHGDACPLARGFYDRLPAARAAALAARAGVDGEPVALSRLLDKPTVRSIALAHQVCPYYLTLELARWCDVVVGDYNHYFDSHALLHGLAQAGPWRVAVLVDEAHNLVERARRMYSAELPHAGLLAAKRSAPAALAKPLARLQRRWQQLHRDHAAPYQVLDALPAPWLTALQQATQAITAHLAEHPTLVNAALQAFYFDALHFQRLAESLDRHSLVDLARDATRDRKATLCIRNVVPGPFLGPRFAAAHTTTLFSATLQPFGYHRELLGLPQDTLTTEVASPFATTQLKVQVARHISTRYQHRTLSLKAIVDVMARQHAARPGNYLAFFSSHDYLQAVASLFEASHPHLTVHKQARHMPEAAQQAFLAGFTPDSQAIGFAVLGGSFGEAVDLPGKRLIGAFIATLGLPQVNPVNEQIRQRLDQLLGAGYDYTYLFPGLQKVVQAAGRVIRGPDDEGVLHLLDDRYRRADVQRLLPRWWQVT